ncbi:DUF1365 domain-containing protein [Pseudoalteromonas tunicata]|jgi:DUF1365 family protein|uniref:Plasmid partition ParA protein n=1 Tax=Pseudoalteromonas tunicata D2 TaxID=87626 RepID=A4C4B0_9GAMM|nr:DUF1365 domain-containing protein [Pseudoalteromonas tunicata]ATC97126.1 hypothetical protein PTUN_b0789 [Pseudoalteromonas tunicata]AXT33234.1 DUF1365 domain-containing protein [Pseudoalteromonas tunicata]EAR30392.1 plasmid partition ParA protein [Pseudoalteromonas tunicata D2]
MIVNSGIYQGHIRHRRFSPVSHVFNYQLSTFGIDLDEVDELCSKHRLFGRQWYKLIRFCEKDYLKNEPGTLKQRIASTVKRLGGTWDGGRVMFVGQCRSLGIYFSPINLFYCFNKDDSCVWMLAEVSNTPWNERHYYLININSDAMTAKDFHVSPFMEMNMKYKWRVSQPQQRLLVHIENHPMHTQGVKVFDATMAMKKQPFSSLAYLKMWLSLPFMTLKVMSGIYWQALLLFIKRVPFVPYEHR